MWNDMGQSNVIFCWASLLLLLCSLVHGETAVHSRSASSHRRISKHNPSRSHYFSRHEGNPLQGFKIVCLFNNKHHYMQDFTPSMIDPSLCTHINYEFAILDPKTHEMIIGDTELDINNNFYQEVVDLKKKNPKLKVMISLGGWEDSTKKYSEMAADKSNRKKFIDKAVDFMKEREFDGMDLAWEYPNCWQGAIGINPKDKDNFVLLLQELRERFGKEKLELSVSVGAIKREVEAAYDVPKISSVVDHINVMTYDMHGPWESETGHHTQFDKMPGDSDPYCNVKAALDIWVQKGADKKKLNMGIPFYAKTFTLVDPKNFGLGAPTKGIGNPGKHTKQGGMLFYNEVCENLNSANWTEKKEENIGYYAYSEDQWACYDPPMMVVKKVKYIVESGFGGVLLKDLSGDDFEGKCFSLPFVLTKMIRLQMIQSIRKLNHK